MVLNQGISAGSKFYQLLIKKIKLWTLKMQNKFKLKILILFFNAFAYNIEEKQTLKSINLEIKGGKMTSLVGHSGSGGQQY